MIKEEIIELAIQAGIKHRTDEFYSEFCDGVYFDDLITFAKLVAEKSKQDEPVGWLDSNDIQAEFMHKDLKAEHDKRGSFTPRMFQIPVYTTPQPRTWIGLLHDEKEHIEIAGGKADLTLAEKIEAILKEKNT